MARWYKFILWSKVQQPLLNSICSFSEITSNSSQVQSVSQSARSKVYRIKRKSTIYPMRKANKLGDNSMGLTYFLFWKNGKMFIVCLQHLEIRPEELTEVKTSAKILAHQQEFALNNSFGIKSNQGVLPDWQVSKESSTSLKCQKELYQQKQQTKM